MRLSLAAGLLVALGATACDQLTSPRNAASAPETSVATLTALTVSSGTLSPAFSAATTTYTLPVANSVASITVTPVGTADQVVTVNGGLVPNGSSSPSIGLPVGTSTVTIRVAASSGTPTQSYTIAVTRAP